ncbi:ParB domain protein nuclease [Thermodesulfatator indicus DSM 15286]|uniref:ParB domain protein nuclease n=1 Tax=Thermodesulfatator indicus (strain DSM 15286 / JCM 11887 / CIR29812) TaxID=667014 RepID=F8A8F0_THEID|nr:ParB N-terminal domain-containing protein [Thermodesulfatator indicus]AEH43954.1 ParB domain protein nuclease [Thermodesulfatator indicus DSM 15286]
MKIDLKSVSLQEVLFEDETFAISYPPRVVFLIESIKRIGIINPPILRPSPRGLQIVSGRGRLEAARELKIEKVTCNVLPYETGDTFCLDLVIEENLTSRGLNLVEKALVVRKYHTYLTDERIIKEVLPRLGFAPHYHHFEVLKAIASLGDMAWNFLIENRLNPKVAVKLAGLDKVNQKKFLEILSKLKLSSSRQRLFWEMLEDLSRKKAQSFKQIIEEISVTSLLNEERLSPHQKTEKLFKQLAKELMPVYSAREAKIKKISSRLHELGAKIKFTPFLEKDSMCLEINFKSAEEIEKKWPKIREIIGEEF